jgi:hypothetical protein
LQTRKASQALKSSAQSLIRVAEEKVAVRRSLTGEDVRDGLEKVIRPNSIAGRMKKAGVVLMLSPDPITDIPGAALLASAYLLKKREPSSVETLVHEARKILRDIESIVI